MYYIYMLRCEDKSLYTGITTNVQRRMKEHFSQGKKCAKYTKRHKAERLEAVWETEDRIHASKLEFAIKTLKKEEKEKLICEELQLKDVFEERLECAKYKKINE